MLAASHALACLAILSVGVIYGTDIFSATVLRPAMAALTDRELTQAAGRIHQYGDQRLPLPGAAGTVAAAAAAICAGVAGHAAAAALAGAALVALLGWLGLYLRIAAPINHRMTKAAHDQQPPRHPHDAETLGLNHHNPRVATGQRDGTAHRDPRQLIKLPRPSASPASPASPT
jgi:hypothetical protein